MLQVLQQIANVRCKQFYRMLCSIGIWLLLLISPILFIAILGLLEKIQEGAAIEFSVYALLLLMINHLFRKDSLFLQKLNVAPFFIYLVDYMLLFLPLNMIVLLLTGNWQLPLIITIGIPIIALLPQIKWRPFQMRRGVALNWIPIEAFEWRTGLREYFYWMALLYIIALCLCQFIATALVSTIVFGAITVGYYSYIEAKEMAEVIAYRSSFLKRKASLLSLMFHGLMLPHYLLFLVFHFQYWYILLVVMFMIELLLLFGLFFKYANFYPGRGKLYNQMPLGLFMMGALIPICTPVSLCFLIIYYKRAVKNLNYYYA